MFYLFKNTKSCMSNPSFSLLLTFTLFLFLTNLSEKKTKDSQVSLLPSEWSAKGVGPRIRRLLRSPGSTGSYQVQHLGATQRPQSSTL